MHDCQGFCLHPDDRIGWIAIILLKQIVGNTGIRIYQLLVIMQKGGHEVLWISLYKEKKDL